MKKYEIIEKIMFSVSITFFVFAVTLAYIALP